MDSAMGVTKAVELATKASKWSQTYLGTPLSKLPLDPTTVSEVLRFVVGILYWNMLYMLLKQNV